MTISFLMHGFGGSKIASIEVKKIILMSTSVDKQTHNQELSLLQMGYL